MSTTHEALLKELAQEDFYLREEAAQRVDNGMELLVSSKRLLQKIDLSEQEAEDLRDTIIDLVVAGNALRTAIQTLKIHHQRAEAPWIDQDGGIHMILRNGIEFEGKVERILTLIREAMQERRKQKRR